MLVFHPARTGGCKLCGYIHPRDHTPSSLPARISGSRLWPRAVIGHTEPRSLCFRPAETCGRHAQAVGLVNLRDSSVRPKVSALLLYNDFSPTQIPSVPQSGPNPRDLVSGLWCEMCILPACVWQSVSVSSHIPPDSAHILILLRGCDYTCLSSLLASFLLECCSGCLAWTYLACFFKLQLWVPDWVRYGSVNK